MAPRTGSVEVRALQEDEFPSWRAFVDSAPAGSVYSYPEYLDVLCRVAGGSFRVMAAFKGDEIHGGIALYERSGVAGRILSGRLLLYYNGIVLKEFTGKYPSENSSREIAVMAALEESLSKEGFGHTHVRNRHPITDLRVFLQRGWNVRPSYSLLMRLDDLEEALGRVEQNQRRLIRRCEGEGVVLKSDDDFEAFYRVHAGTHHRKGAPIYLPESRFRRYFEELRSQNLCQLFHACLLNGTPVASQLVLLGGHPVTHTVTAGADPKALRLGVTPFLRWRTCEHLAVQGYQGNDLTDASVNPVTSFKAQLGGDLVMNLVLSRPDSIRYRASRTLLRTGRRGKALLGRILRASRTFTRPGR